VSVLAALQPCGPRDNYAILYYVPKMTWEQVGQDYNEAVRRRAAKEQELLLGVREERERSAQPDTTLKAPSSLEELRNAFLAQKRKDRKKDRTPLQEETIRGYEWLTRDFLDITKCQFPGDITGEHVNNWMLVLEDGYTSREGKVHKPAGPRTVYNLYTNIGCFLRFCGIEPNPSSKHSYGLRKLVGTNVPRKNDPPPEAFTQEERDKFFFVITDERDALAFELYLKTGPRERELTNLEWADLELDFSRVWYRCKKDATGKFTFRTKTGNDRWVPLEKDLAEKLRAWREKNPNTRYVFGTKADKIEGHFLRLMKHYAKLSRQEPAQFWLHKLRDSFASWCLRRNVDLRTIQA
jgi:integrase